MAVLPAEKQVKELSKPVSIPYKVITNTPPLSLPVPRICLVTGGTGGIGSAICKRLAKAGHIVATTYRNEEKARAWEAEMKKEGYTFHLYAWFYQGSCAGSSKKRYHGKYCISWLYRYGHD